MALMTGAKIANEVLAEINDEAEHQFSDAVRGKIKEIVQCTHMLAEGQKKLARLQEELKTMQHEPIPDSVLG